MFYLTQLGVEKDSQIDVKFMAFGGGLLGHNASLNYDIRYHQNNFCHPKVYFALTVGFMISSA